MSTTLDDCLRRFDQLQEKFPGPAPDTICMGQPGAHPHLVLSILIHGDEVGPVPAALDFIEELECDAATLNGRVTLILGNRRAALQQRRFTEQDLNRVFLAEAPDSYEKDRAAELMPVVREADLMLDFHQTIQPSVQSFYIFAFDRPTYLWARALGGAEVLVTRKRGGVFAAGWLSMDEYCLQRGIPSATLELGQKGFSEMSYQKAFATMNRAWKLINEMKDVRDLNELERLAAREPQLSLFKQAGTQRFSSPDFRLVEGIKNFQAVKTGELLGSGLEGTELRAPGDGYLLFPKYPERDEAGQALRPLPVDIYVFLQEAAMEDFI